MTTYDQLIQLGEEKGRAEGEARGEARGRAEERRKNIARLLMKGLLTVSDISETLETPLEWVVEIRDQLMAESVVLMQEIRSFKMQA